MSDQPWPTTSSQLLSRMRRRDDNDSWAEFVRSYGPLLVRYCARCGLQEADAHDAAQEALIAVARGFKTFRYDRSKGRFRGWLYAIVRHAVHAHRKRLEQPGRGVGGCNDLVLQNLETTTEPEWIEEFNAHIYSLAVERVRERLGEEAWRAFSEVWLDERKPAEVARRMNRNREWVYKAKFRGLQLLKSEIIALAADDDIFLDLPPAPGSIADSRHVE